MMEPFLWRAHTMQDQNLFFPSRLVKMICLELRHKMGGNAAALTLFYVFRHKLKRELIWFLKSIEFYCLPIVSCLPQHYIVAKITLPYHSTYSLQASRQHTFRLIGFLN